MSNRKPSRSRRLARPPSCSFSRRRERRHPRQRGNTPSRVPDSGSDHDDGLVGQRLHISSDHMYGDKSVSHECRVSAIHGSDSRRPLRPGRSVSSGLPSVTGDPMANGLWFAGRAPYRSFSSPSRAVDGWVVQDANRLAPESIVHVGFDHRWFLDARGRTSVMNGRTAVVTGGTRGIGRAVAGAFATEGATVVVGARDGEALERTVEALEETGGNAAGVRTDVRDEFDVERLVEVASKAGDGSGSMSSSLPPASITAIRARRRRTKSRTPLSTTTGGRTRAASSRPSGKRSHT